MAYIAVNYDKTEFIYEFQPWAVDYVLGERWYQKEINGEKTRCRRLRKGVVEKLLGHKMFFHTKPLEYRPELSFDKILEEFERKGYLSNDELGLYELLNT